MIPKIKTIPIRIMNKKGRTFGQFGQKRENTKIRNPTKYLVEKHGVPTQYARKFLAQPAVIHRNWEEDNSGPYIEKSFLDSVGYGWNHERKEFMEALKSTERVREASRKAMKKEYGKTLTKKEMNERISKMPQKYQKGLRRTQRIMKKIL